ncbi:hypothetical protein ABKN59_007978 [Abortiporus biennis]
MSNEVAEIIESFWVAFFGTASYVSIAALALYDHCITIDREVQHIWKKRLNILSVFFIVNRYALLIATLGMASTELFPRARSRSVILIRWPSHNKDTKSFIQLSRSQLPRLGVYDFLRHCSFIILCSSIMSINAVNNLKPTYVGIFPLQSPYGGCIMAGILLKNVPIRCTKFKLRLICHPHHLTFFSFLQDGTIYLCLTFILNILQTAIFNVSNRVPGMELAFPEEFGLHRLRPVIVSHMILDLKEIDQVVMGSQAETGHSGRFSSIHFVGNVGAPLNTSLMGDNDEVSRPCIITPVSTKQFIEDPLSIGLFGEEVIDPDSDRRPGPISGAENIVVEV